MVKISDIVWYILGLAGGVLAMSIHHQGKCDKVKIVIAETMNERPCPNPEVCNSMESLMIAVCDAVCE